MWPGLASACRPILDTPSTLLSESAEYFLIAFIYCCCCLVTLTKRVYYGIILKIATRRYAGQTSVCACVWTCSVHGWLADHWVGSVLFLGESGSGWKLARASGRGGVCHGAGWRWGRSHQWQQLGHNARNQWESEGQWLFLEFSLYSLVPSLFCNCIIIWLFPVY